MSLKSSPRFVPLANHRRNGGDSRGDWYTEESPRDEHCQHFG